MKPRTFKSLLLASTLLSLLILPGCSSKDSNTPTGTVAEPFESGDMPNGRNFQRTFATAGSFSYRCRFHAGMTGSVHVATGHTDSVVVTITNNLFTPSTALVNPGGYVRWINQGSTHSVTRPKRRRGWAAPATTGLAAAPAGRGDAPRTACRATDEAPAGAWHAPCFMRDQKQSFRRPRGKSCTRSTNRVAGWQAW